MTRPPTSSTPEYTPDVDRDHPRPTRPLTPAEERVARLLARGQRAPEIAVTLGLSPRTVQEHINRIAAKLPGGDLTPRDRVLVWAYWEYRAA